MTALDQFLNPNIRIYDNDKVYSYSDIEQLINNYERSLLEADLIKFSKVEIAIISIDVFSIALLLFLLTRRIAFKSARYSSSILLSDNTDVFLISDIIDNVPCTAYGKYFDLRKDYKEFPGSTRVDPTVFDTLQGPMIYLSGGTTGLPKELKHSIDTLKVAVKNMQKIYHSCNVCLLISDQTLNHYGVMTTTILSAIKYCDMVAIINPWTFNVANPDIPPANILTVLFHNIPLLEKFSSVGMVKPETRIITGGMAISMQNAKALLSILPDASIFNVYGCTELTTPLAWNIINAENLNTKPINEMDVVIDDLQIITDEKKLITHFRSETAFYSKENVECPDIITLTDKNTFAFAGRRWEMLSRQIKNSNRHLIIGQPEIYDWVKSLIACEFVVIGYKNKVTEHKFESVVIIVTDRDCGLSIKEINDSILESIRCRGIELESTHNIVTNIFIANLKEFNNGLKIDTRRLLEAYMSRGHSNG